jgi:hypothetical protein
MSRAKRGAPTAALSHPPKRGNLSREQFLLGHPHSAPLLFPPVGCGDIVCRCSVKDVLHHQFSLDSNDGLSPPAVRSYSAVCSFLTGKLRYLSE